jgi:hypothetical protein
MSNCVTPAEKRLHEVLVTPAVRIPTRLVLLFTPCLTQLSVVEAVLAV